MIGGELLHGLSEDKDGSKGDGHSPSVFRQYRF